MMQYAKILSDILHSYNISRPVLNESGMYMFEAFSKIIDHKKVVLKHDVVKEFSPIFNDSGTNVSIYLSRNMKHTAAYNICVKLLKDIVREIYPGYEDIQFHKTTNVHSISELWYKQHEELERYVRSHTRLQKIVLADFSRSR